MTTLNLSNVRLILDAYSRCASITFFGGECFQYSKDGFSALYSITEERYKIDDNYKIGFLGNKFQGTPEKDFYQSDLKTLIKKSQNPHAGFYQIVYTDKFNEGDLAYVPVVIEGTDKVVFEIPFLIVHIESGYAFVKSAIELFEKPIKKSLWDFVTRNKYWDCQKIDLSEITQKFEKLDTKTVMPGYQYEKDENAA